MPPEWTPTQLGHVGKWFSGGTPSLDAREYWGGAIPSVSPKDMKKFELWDTEDHITERGLEKGSRAVDTGNLLVVVRGMILAHTFPVAIAMTRMAFNQDIKAIRCHSHVDPRFMAHWLVGDSAKILTKVTDTSHGTKRFDVRQLQRHPVLLPPHDEQQIIAGILDAGDAAIERTRTAIATAERLKCGLVQTLFTRGIGHSKFVKSEVGTIPKAWSVMPVADVLEEAQYGISMPMSATGKYPILRMAAIQDGDVNLNDLKYVDLPEPFANIYLLKRGDILFNRVNSAELVGKVGVFRSDAPAVFASYLIRLQTKAEKVNNYFLGQLLASYAVQCRLKRYATPGVQQVNINATNLQRVLIAVPVGEEGLREQEAIADILERQDASIRDLKARVVALRTLKRGLMQNLLTGRVRVKLPAASGNGVVRSRP